MSGPLSPGCVLWRRGNLSATLSVRERVGCRRRCRLGAFPTRHHAYALPELHHTSPVRRIQLQAHSAALLSPPGIASIFLVRISATLIATRDRRRSGDTQCRLRWGRRAQRRGQQADTLRTVTGGARSASPIARRRDELQHSRSAPGLWSSQGQCADDVRGDAARPPRPWSRQPLRRGGPLVRSCRSGAWRTSHSARRACRPYPERASTETRPGSPVAPSRSSVEGVRSGTGLPAIRWSCARRRDSHRCRIAGDELILDAQWIDPRRPRRSAAATAGSNRVDRHVRHRAIAWAEAASARARSRSSWTCWAASRAARRTSCSRRPRGLIERASGIARVPAGRPACAGRSSAHARRINGAEPLATRRRRCGAAQLGVRRRRVAPPGRARAGHRTRSAPPATPLPTLLDRLGLEQSARDEPRGPASSRARPIVRFTHPAPARASPGSQRPMSARRHARAGVRRSRRRGYAGHLRPLLTRPDEQPRPP